MCVGCWKKYGQPGIINEKTLRAAELVEQVYERAVTGGNLHVQLDDWNLEDEFFDGFKVYHDDLGSEQIDIERRCFEAFKAMTLEERASALALHDGWLDNRVGQD